MKFPNAAVLLIVVTTALHGSEAFVPVSFRTNHVRALPMLNGGYLDSLSGPQKNEAEQPPNGAAQYPPSTPTSRIEVENQLEALKAQDVKRTELEQQVKALEAERIAEQRKRAESEQKVRALEAERVAAGQNTAEYERKIKSQLKVEAERKVQIIETTLERQESEHQKAMDRMADEMKKHEADAKDRVQELENTLQEFATFAQKKLLDEQETTKAKEDELNRKLLEVQEASKVTEDKLRHEMQLIMKERAELQAQLEELKKAYTEETMDWEDRLEHEQDLRSKQERDAETEKIRIMEEARQKFNFAKIDSTKHMIKREQKLKHQEHEVIQAEWNLGVKEMEVQRLARDFEELKTSIPLMARTSLDMIKKGAKDKIQGFKKRVSSSSVSTKDRVQDFAKDRMQGVKKRVEKVNGMKLPGTKKDEPGR